MKNQKKTITIHDIGSSGEGVGYDEGFTLFVPGALPGESVDTEIFQRQKRFGRGRLLAIHTPSTQRVEPICPVYGQCGGCQLMHASYAQQLEFKRSRVTNALKRIAKIEADVPPCIPSPSPLAYRNKIQLPVRNSEEGVQIGLYATGSHDLVPIEKCYIHCPLGEEVFQRVKILIKPIHKLKHLLIKSAVNAAEVMIILVTDSEPNSHLQILAKQIMNCHPAVKSVIHNQNECETNVILGDIYNELEGSSHICETICGLTFKLSPQSFFQVNTPQAENIYHKVLELASVTSEDTVLDAYCGVGTLSLLLARQAKHVIGVECVAAAIDNARENAAINQIHNVSFSAANAEDFVRELSHIDVAVLNPPRKGCEPSLLETIGKLKPQKVIYVSCDPATLARDLAQLSSYGYVVDLVQPYDMFPQTAHVECVAKLSQGPQRP